VDHSSWFGLPKSSRDWYYWLYPSECSIRRCQGIHALTTPLQFEDEPIKLLRQLTHLAIIEANLEEELDCRPVERALENARETWRRELISLLKDSPSTDRKILRWKLVQNCRHPRGTGRVYNVVETEELEVSPKTSL